MKKLFVFILCFYSVCVYGQVVNNVRLLDHTSYAIRVIGDTLREVEQRGWHTLTIPAFTQEINETVLDWPVSGNVTYKNGFVTSIQWLDILQMTVQQIWRSTGTDHGTVEVQGTMRMNDVTLGYDIDAHLNGQDQHYTGLHAYHLISFAFVVVRDLHTDQYSVTVTGSVTPTSSIIQILPKNNYTDVLDSLFSANSATVTAGITAWGANVFAPIFLDIVTNRVEFPVICYDCPVTA